MSAAPHNGLLHDGLIFGARRYPDKPAAVMDDEDAVTYGELHRWSDAAAHRLRVAGVAEGDRVAIAASNGLEWIATAYGVLKLGAVIAPFNDRLIPDELRFLAELCEPKLIVADAARRERLNAAEITVPTLDMEDIVALRGGSAEPLAETRPSSDSLAMILFTSGSTARPKGVMMTHQSFLMKFMEVMLLDTRLGSGTRSLMPFGLHATPGVAWGICFSHTIGGTLYFTRKYSPERTLRTLAEQRIGYFIGVPMMYDEMSRLPDFQTADFPALTFARVGGAAASASAFAAWKDKGVILRQLYGMTEVGGGTLIATEEEAWRKPNSCGRGLAFSRVRIVRADGSDCDPDEAGDVLLQGPGMMSGYWRDPAATAEAIGTGWMRTGDIGALDADGDFHFVDRAKEMIKSGGYNVSPAEIEGVLRTFPGLLEAAVFAVADPRYGEAPCACVYLETKGEEQAVFEHCRQKLAGYKLPRYIVALDGPLPRLANEKIDRRRLKIDYSDIASRTARLGSATAADV